MTSKKNPVGWFEIPVEDVPRAQAFYEHVFGVELEIHEMGPLEMAWFPMVENAIGCPGSLVKGEGFQPSAGGVLIYFTAPDLDAALLRGKEKGGQIILEKFSIGPYGFIGILQDTEGNRIGLHTMEES